MINQIIEVFRSAGNKRFEASKAGWMVYLKRMDDDKLNILADLIQDIDIQGIDLCRLSGYIEMAAMERLPDFDSLGFDRNDPRLYDASWSKYI